MLGLTTTSAATGALLLNLEGVLTAVMAWLVFRENVDLQIFLGMAAIVAGGVALSWHPGTAALSPGALLIAGACLCWAIDNNLTRKVSTHDAMFIACLKGLVAGAANLSIALMLGDRLPGVTTMLAAMATGFAGYGVSLVLSSSPCAISAPRERAPISRSPPCSGWRSRCRSGPRCRRRSSGSPPRSWPSGCGCISASGTSMRTHMSRSRDAHLHRHDAHHQHAHDFPYGGDAAHTHPHHHAPIAHTHAHFPDIHHRHVHRGVK